MCYTDNRKRTIKGGIVRGQERVNPQILQEQIERLQESVQRSEASVKSRAEIVGKNRVSVDAGVKRTAELFDKLTAPRQQYEAAMLTYLKAKDSGENTTELQGKADKLARSYFRAGGPDAQYKSKKDETTGEQGRLEWAQTELLQAERLLDVNRQVLQDAEDRFSQLSKPTLPGTGVPTTPKGGDPAGIITGSSAQRIAQMRLQRSASRVPNQRSPIPGGPPDDRRTVDTAPPSPDSTASAGSPGRPTGETGENNKEGAGNAASSAESASGENQPNVRLGNLRAGLFSQAGKAEKAASASTRPASTSEMDNESPDSSGPSPG